MDQVCFMGDPEAGEQNECFSMPLCGENGHCPTEFGGSVCNLKADGNKIISSKTAICLMGVCLTDDNCPGEQKCEVMFGEMGYCERGMDMGDCETDDDCPEGEVCESGFCMPDFGF